jgi:hypothetical protein
MATTFPTDRRPTGGRHLGFRAVMVLVEGIAVSLHPPLLVLHALSERGCSPGSPCVTSPWARCALSAERVTVSRQP